MGNSSYDGEAPAEGKVPGKVKIKVLGNKRGTLSPLLRTCLVCVVVADITSADG